MAKLSAEQWDELYDKFYETAQDADVQRGKETTDRKENKMTTGDYIRENADWETITYTKDELANTFDGVETGALLDAADRLWENVRYDVESYWEWLDLIKEETGPVYDNERRRNTDALQRKLTVYNKAFKVLGCVLHVTFDWCPTMVYEVTLTYGNSVRGCIANN